MPKVKAKKFAQMKRIVSFRDERIESRRVENEEKRKKDEERRIKATEAPQASSALFFTYNSALGPPYRVIVDTNFINHSITRKMDIVQSMMDCLLAKCTPCITDCIIAELEKLGTKFRVALRIAKDPRFERIQCTHKGTYADDCICNVVARSPVYIVATNDRDLKRRLRKIPGVPIMYISGKSSKRYNIERLPEAYGAPRV
ncbi:MAG: putative rRNA-processing protein FCF1 [Streblomastix strix]|uniref:Putative rRNA-processing protein FCF1 n=1 Tax=Streblomastix strix TaxID=222440 RepID=A0A5J4U5U4_9EUKA|nr:MAG: putative rRNA-processing protein FCF1 [Streblomastix strix]KAA6374903.1 MAG: putative rRNA-processing protein FCF1 [Streblomastix strix]